jgi:superfamily II DNA or RNA helicase
MFPNAIGLGVTATPLRADGKGLGAHSDGIFTEMIVGPNMRELINMGFLTEYRIFAPAADIDLSDVNVTATGDYSKTKLKAAVKKSTITGDIVKHYLQHAKDKLGVTFATDVEAAVEISQAFNASGVRAEVVSAKTNDSARSAILERFRRREIVQLVNVDLFGEGFDLPAIEVVSMARPTQSYGLYVQQFGRALRLLDGKERAIIIDHVGNVIRHGLPDIGRDWTLDRREKRSSAKRDDVEDLKACQSCTGVFERFRTTCPYCGHKPEPVDRSGPEFVDGDLTELDGPTLARMRGEKDVVDMSHDEFRQHLATKHVPPIGQLAQLKRHGEQQLAQVTLRESIAWWAAWKRQDGIPDAESYRIFYLTFGIDVLTAQTLKTKEALHLNKLIKELTPCH